MSSPTPSRNSGSDRDDGSTNSDGAVDADASLKQRDELLRLEQQQLYAMTSAFQCCQSMKADNQETRVSDGLIALQCDFFRSDIEKLRTDGANRVPGTSLDGSLSLTRHRSEWLANALEPISGPHDNTSSVLFQSQLRDLTDSLQCRDPNFSERIETMKEQIKSTQDVLTEAYSLWIPTQKQTVYDDNRSNRVVFVTQVDTEESKIVKSAYASAVKALTAQSERLSSLAGRDSIETV